MKITVLTYNTLFAGRDGSDDSRARAQIDLINDIKPDVFLMQEAKGFDSRGGAWLYALERDIAMRGFLAIAPRTRQNVAIFIREPLRPISFENDSTHFHHALATLVVALPDGKNQITFTNAHLCPNSAGIRHREAGYLGVLAVPDTLAILTGDFNSVSPHDPEPEGFEALAAHHRIRYLAEDMLTADRSVLTLLETAGWVDVGHALDSSAASTTPTSGFTDTEFATMRCDYVLSTQLLATYAQSYRVIHDEITERASDHYPVLTVFALPQ